MLQVQQYLQQVAYARRGLRKLRGNVLHARLTSFLTVRKESVNVIQEVLNLKRNALSVPAIKYLIKGQANVAAKRISSKLSSILV